jgi:hypothetical protein
MRPLLRIACAGVLLVGFAGAQTETNVEARAIWERAVEVKGGRARLHEIESLLMILPRRDEPERSRYVDLYVFPDSSWRWSDALGSGYLGLSLTVSNERGAWWAVLPERVADPREQLQWRPPLEQDLLQVVNQQAVFLLETRWLQPEILDVRSERISRRDYHVVTADVPGQRLEYFIDAETHLVRQIRQVTEFSEFGFISNWDFEGYEAVDGIMMPTRTEVQGLNPNIVQAWEFQFNVDYDPEIFDREPVLEDGPQSWMKR